MNSLCFLCTSQPQPWPAKSLNLSAFSSSLPATVSLSLKKKSFEESEGLNPLIFIHTNAGFIWLTALLFPPPPLFPCPFITLGKFTSHPNCLETPEPYGWLGRNWTCSTPRGDAFITDLYFELPPVLWTKDRAEIAKRGPQLDQISRLSFYVRSSYSEHRVCPLMPVNSWLLVASVCAQNCASLPCKKKKLCLF